jgi:hypothetical protein
MKLINTDVGSRGSSFASDLDNEALGVVIFAEAQAREWQRLADTCDKTRRWLADSLKAAASDRDRAMQDARPVADAQNAAWAKLQEAKRALDRADDDHDRGVERVVAAEIKENEAFERWRDAVARGAKSEETWVLRQRWAQSAGEALDAMSAAFNLFQTLSRAREDANRAYADLAQSQRQMRDFAAAANADRIVEQFNNFTQWTDLFEREINR